MYPKLARVDIFEFAKRFDTEEKCRNYLKEQREQHGICCKNCGGQSHFHLSNKKQRQCRVCDCRTTLTSGTIMANTKLPIQKWFLAMFWMTNSKRNISTLELMRQLELTKFETEHNLAKKIKLMMSHYNDKLTHGQYNEADESFVVTAHNRKNSPKAGGPNKSLYILSLHLSPYNPSPPKMVKH